MFLVVPALSGPGQEYDWPFGELGLPYLVGSTDTRCFLDVFICGVNPTLLSWNSHHPWSKSIRPGVGGSLKTWVWVLPHPLEPFSIVGKARSWDSEDASLHHRGIYFYFKIYRYNPLRESNQTDEYACVYTYRYTPQHLSEFKCKQVYSLVITCNNSKAHLPFNP